VAIVCHIRAKNIPWCYALYLHVYHEKYVRKVFMTGLKTISCHKQVYDCHKSNLAEKYWQVLSCSWIHKYTPNYNILHRVNVSRYIWNVTVTYLDTFINNVSRLVTISKYMSAI